jgi:Formyl transferase
MAGGLESPPMRTVLLYHEGARLEQQVMAPWLASFSDLAGIIVLGNARQRLARRVRREIRRVGPLRFVDVLAFRLLYRLTQTGADRAWEASFARDLARRYPPVADDVPVLRAQSPNSDDVRHFLEESVPDMIIARCRTLIAERIFSIPTLGTFVLHPGIAPEYRNSHGCFWALANRDLERVGMTLLKIDSGVDTGPIYGYYTYDYNEATESHVVIQKRVVFENLNALREKLLEIQSGGAAALDVAGRASAAWGQPWLTRYLRWKVTARRGRA